MRPCSAALKAFLEGPAREAVQIDLYTFALQTGEVLRWTSGNAALAVPAAGFPAGSLNAGADRTFLLGPGFSRSKVSSKLGVEAGELQIEVYAGSDDTVGNLAFGNAARLGLFDGATVELDRFFAPAATYPLDTSLGCMIWFHGRVAEVEIGRSAVRLTVKDMRNVLSVTQWPRRIYGSSCNHLFGGTMCGYDREAGKNALGGATGWGKQTIAAGVGSSQAAIYSGYVPSISPSPYVEGTIRGVTGANAGFKRSITGHAGGIVYFLPAWIHPVSVGDTFDLIPGCPRSTDVCQNVFNNIGRFGGFPRIPRPEYAIGIALAAMTSFAWLFGNMV